jgi:hypothetical protein
MNREDRRETIFLDGSEWECFWKLWGTQNRSAGACANLVSGMRWFLRTYNAVRGAEETRSANRLLDVPGIAFKRWSPA